MSRRPATICDKLRSVDHMDVEDCFLQSPLYSQAADVIDALISALEDSKKFVDGYSGKGVDKLKAKVDKALAKAKGEA